MRYRDAPAFRQALEDRLKNRAQGDGARVARERKRVVFDRLLARLLSVAPGQWLLKGGFALELRLAERARTTKDVDIDWQAEHETLIDVLLEVAAHDAADYFAFAIERTGVPEDRLGGSHRFKVTASLAGRLFETFLLDVGFRHDENVAAETLHTGDLLAFAGLRTMEVEAVPLELHTAEKLHAYTPRLRWSEAEHPHEGSDRHRPDCVPVQPRRRDAAAGDLGYLHDARDAPCAPGTAQAPGRMGDAVSAPRRRGRRPGCPRERTLRSIGSSHTDTRR